MTKSKTCQIRIYRDVDGLFAVSHSDANVYPREMVVDLKSTLEQARDRAIAEGKARAPYYQATTIVEDI